MPVSPELAADLAAAVSSRYAEAEQVMLATIAKALAKGMDAPGWAERKLANVRNLQSEIRLLLKELDPAAAKLVAEAVQTAWDRGAAVAAKDLATELIGPSAPSRAVARLTSETIGNVVGTHPRILRSSMDAYRSVIAKVSAQALIGTQTRRSSTQAALDVFARKGITGFIDKSGRGWRLESYVEMSVRSTTAHAAVAAHTDTLVANGQDLVMVSNAPQECEQCRPWEGEVLSLTGDTKGRKTLQQATSAGLFHPGCRHSTGIYLPGVTKPMHDTADPEGDAARQQLRYLERQTRAWKRVQAVALDDDAARKAGSSARAYQARIREHVATTSAKRQPARERLGVL